MSYLIRKERFAWWPVVPLILGAIFLKERVSRLQAVGIIVTLIGVVLLQA